MTLRCCFVSMSLVLASLQARVDEFVRLWFQRILKGTRTPKPAREHEPEELWRLVQYSRSIEIAEGEEGVLR